MLDYFNNYDYPASKTFHEQGEGLVQKTEHDVQSVPFKPYWYHNINLRDLDPPQTKWYDYWRTQVRVGNYIRTDLGYVFLYANEVLNMVEFKNCHDAYECLVKLWSHYRTIEVPRNQYVMAIWDEKQFISAMIHPLDRYLVDWIADFIHIYKLPVKVTDWYMFAIDTGAVLSDRQLFIELWLQSGRSLNSIPVDGLFALARYYPPHNKFYEDFHSICNLDDVYRRGVAAIEDFLSHTGSENSSLFVKSIHPYTLKHAPFEGSNIASRRRKITLTNLSLQVDYRILSVHLTNIIKYTENIFRNRVRFRTKLRDIVINGDWMRILDSTFEVKPKIIKIDFQRVLDISRKSDAVRDRLIIENDEELDEIHTDAVNNSATDNIENKVVSFATKQQSIYPKHKTVLLGFRDQSWQLSERAMKSVVADEFIDVVIDNINEWAVDSLGDILIVEIDGQYVLVEDYRSEITTLLD